MYELKKEIENILETELKGFYYLTEIRNYPLENKQFLLIGISTSNYQQNGIGGHFYNWVEFNIDNNLEFNFAVLSKGQYITRKIDPAIDKEKYKALGSEKIPFRTPKKEKKAVLKAIKNICIKYKSILKDIASRGLLLSEDLPTTLELIARC